MRKILSFALVLVVGMVFGPTSGLSAANGPYSPGAPGVGDAYFPEYGNGGYDAQHYDLQIRYQPRTDELWGVATIEAEATQGLSSFNLDLVGLTVRDVKVDGVTGSWSRTEHELTVVPATPIDDEASFTVRVRYDGVPITYFDPYSLGVQVGFMHTNDGAIVTGEPDVAVFWYPCNDHPQDRATYAFEVTVPDRYEVVANGLPAGHRSSDGWTTHVWNASDPMAAYLATIDIGNWIVESYVTARGLRVIDAIDPHQHDSALAVLDREEEVLAFLEDEFGPYPFGSAGAIVDDYPGYSFAMEMQTRPVYPSVWFKWGYKYDWMTSTVLHELAHMWFGDLVVVDQWKDVWLNEGISSYAEWLWAEHEGVATPQQILEGSWTDIPADDPFWQIVIGDPGPANMFHWAVYSRGAMTVQALRNEVGDEDFWQILDGWLEAHAWETGSTEEFIALAEQVSGKELDAFFETWLFAPEKPPASAVIVTAPGIRVGSSSVSPEAARWVHRWLGFTELRSR